jgi:hypothetical protein
MTSRRRLSLVAVLLLAIVGLSGCVAIKTESSSTRAPGVVTISLSVCASHRVSGSNCIPPPDATPGQVVNTAEGDNGSDALTSTDPNNPLKGQLVVGFRVPTGTVAADQFTSATGEQFNKSQGYTNALNAAMPPATGFSWVGYVSSAVTLTGGAQLTSLSIELGLPAAADGSPFTGPFLWRAIVGQIGVGFDPGGCSAPSSCFDSPQPGDLGAHFQQNVSDFRVMPGSPPANPTAPGQPATVSFNVRYIDNAGFGARTLTLAGSSTLPGNPRVTPSSATLTNVANNQTRTVTETVTVPVSTAPGNYTVTLTTTDNASGVARSNTAMVTVVDKTAPTISIGSPTDGQVVTQGQQIAAQYSCADETNGSGLASCAGPVPSGAAIDTGTPGQKTFTVTASDKATPPNTATLTHTYTVQAPPPPVVFTTQRPQINISLSFLFSAGKKTTKFRSLSVKGVPKGATVTVRCKGKGCPKQSFTKKNASGSVSLKPYLKKALRKGMVLTISVTKPGAVGMIKTLVIQSSKAPKVTTSCLQPGAKTPTACA